MRGGETSLPSLPNITETGFVARRRFRRRTWSESHLIPRTASPLPCRESAKSSYSRHTPSHRLTPRTPRVFPPEAPGITPAAHDLPRLVSSFVRAVTSLAGDYPADPPRMPFLHARAKSPRAVHALSSGRTQKLPTTHRGGRFAIRHRLRTHSLASAYGFAPFVVELFPAGRFVRSPGLGFRPGPSPLGDRKSPRQRS